MNENLDANKAHLSKAEVEIENYPGDFEKWLWDYFYEIAALDPKKLGWETNRFKETL